MDGDTRFLAAGCFRNKGHRPHLNNSFKHTSTFFLLPIHYHNFFMSHCASFLALCCLTKAKVSDSGKVLAQSIFVEATMAVCNGRARVMVIIY